MNYEETIHYLYTSTPLFQQKGTKAYKPGLETTRTLDKHFGNPHHYYPTIHVAGTNGKGSCAHTIAAFLQLCGLRVGLFTSPHLLDFRERIRINGQMISQKRVIDFVEKERSFFEPLHPSFFELTTAMAFLYFAEEKVDVAVIEVGLGGRLDCTNIITPILSVITNISFDHTQFLGKSLAEIASEKAGIIKKHVPVVIGEALSETKSVFLEKAKEVDAPICFAEDTQEVIENYMTDDYERHYVTKNFGEFDGQLPGRCQEKNTNTILHAISLLLNMDFMNELQKNKSNYMPLIHKAFNEVCSLTGLMGRWQYIGHNPDMVIDTGHNTGCWQYLSKALQNNSYTNVHVVFGIMADKDVKGVLSLLPHNATYYFTRASVERSLDSITLQHQAQEFGLIGKAYKDVAHAMLSVKEKAKPTDLIYIGGSGFVVADYLALKENRTYL